MADLCFQMYAEVADVDQLLDMIRSTSLTDYIRFNGETQPLQLMNPGGFFKKYCMPGELSSNVSLGETVTLEKGYYKGVIFDFPGAEVLIDGKWIAYDNKNKNKDIIMSKNPFALQWRMNGDLLRKLGYKTGDTLSGRVITVDDQWNDLNLSVYSSLAL